MAAVVAAFDKVRRLYGFKRVEVPILEPTAVFARSLGETTDVVSKEMYSFEDRSGDSVTMRPEFTAGIARAFLSEGWQQFAPLKVATHGPAFRYERPQKGRFRQFHQLDAEIIGAAEPQADVEAIAFAAQLLAELGLADRSTLRLNTLGDPETRAEVARRASCPLQAPCRRPQRGQPRTGRAQSAANPRFQGAPGLADRRQRAGHRRVPDRRGGRLLRGGDQRPRRRRSRNGSASRGWCAASIITATPRSSSSPRSLAPSRNCSAAAATTGWSRRWADPTPRRSAGRPGSSGWR